MDGLISRRAAIDALMVLPSKSDVPQDDKNNTEEDWP